MVHCTSLIPSIIVVLVLLVSSSWSPAMSVVAQDAGKECEVDNDGQCIAAEEPSLTVECKDHDKECELWADIGECRANPRFMLEKCTESCGMCGKSRGEIRRLTMEHLQRNAERKEAEKKLSENHGVEQNIPMGQSLFELGVQSWWEKTKQYMEQIVYKEERYKSLSRGSCRNLHPDCTLWATGGECQKNAAYMNDKCQPACRTCHLLLFEERCPYDGSQETNTWKKPGDLSKMFERIVSEPRYQPIRILSRPGGGGGNDDVLDGPWVIAMDDFLSGEECERLVELGTNRGYQRSYVGEKVLGRHTNVLDPHRTSTNAWCVDECHEDKATQTIRKRMEELTGIPDTHAEHFQLLRYEVGQHYARHHDYVARARDRAEGVRIFTVFLYLNDVPAGGGTNFPKLNNLTVTPKRGRVLIWPNVREEDPNERDERTRHQALPVEVGIKYGANAWYHQRDYKEVMLRGCST